ncbi:Predicted hydrolase of the alpha/beta superfamily [Sporobacter termitidis DSM 10068]|uniref:Predicted hydrolase of the alpha/beta superfamily n=1 Tax=Sporobacter termitidis DSM 10068 TaxID=1123282 RepID=A0A1M5VC94_9FIRM|nr:alpha/beta hydrolase-fold protein [Sporobacter termitidis]SHH72811.1 Predicted hydrolase of the alpha/beta superfamily [Sporobacter termitidis DSM 10068]
MKGTITHFQKDGRPVSVYLPKTADRLIPVVYMLAGPDPGLELTGPAERAEAATESGECRPFIAVAAGTRHWNSDYAPWPAPPLLDSEPPFTGGASDLLRWLTEDLMPFIEGEFPVQAGAHGRAVLGYSLAGLAALYAMYVTDAFIACGCCSGSMWYDGWPEFMAANSPRPGSRIYLSLGKKEEKARNPRMAAVGDATRAAHARLSADANVAETALIWHDGGHFSAVPARVSAAMTWLSR